MLDIKAFGSKHVFLTGIGVKCATGDWRYYLPFKISGKSTPYPDGGYPKCHVAFSLALSATRIVVASSSGEIALIDLGDDAIIARAKIRCSPRYVQVSTNGRRLFVQDTYSLFVLDADTLETLQSWYQIERTDAGWRKYTSDEPHSVSQQKEGLGRLQRLFLFDPVTEVDGNILSAPFCKDGSSGDGPHKRSGTYSFEMASGGLVCKVDGQFRDERSWPDKWGPRIATKHHIAPSQGPDAFEAVVERETTVALNVADPSCDAAIRALDDLSAQMERDFYALTCNDAFNLRVFVGGARVNAVDFFRGLVHRNWTEAAPALHRVLSAYLNSIKGGEGDMPWHYSGQALEVLRAVVLLNPDTHGLYRLYLDKGDLEHDHSPYILYAEYLARHGVRNEADVRFGIYLIVSGCFDTEIDPTALLAGAEQVVAAAHFADLSVQEAERYLNGHWVDCRENYVRFLSRSDNTRYQREVIKALKAR